MPICQRGVPSPGSPHVGRSSSVCAWPLRWTSRLMGFPPLCCTISENCDGAVKCRPLAAMIRGGKSFHPADNNNGLIRKGGRPAAMKKENGGKHTGNKKVGGGAGQRDQPALPAGPEKDLMGIAPPLLRRIIAGHAHIAA